MKKRSLKIIAMSFISLTTLTSCAPIQNFIGTILVNIASGLPQLVNNVDLLPGFEDDPNIENIDINPTLIDWESSPTNEANRQDIYYLKNIIAIPKYISTNLLGMDIKLDISVQFTESEERFLATAEDFTIMTINKNDLSQFSDIFDSIPFAVDFAMDLYIPLGESDLLDDIYTFDDLTNIQDTKQQEDFIDALEQTEKEVDFTLKLQSGSKVKTKSFFFGLKSLDITGLALNELFNSNYVINIFTAFPEEGAEQIESLDNPPKAEENRKVIEFFNKSIAVPKHLTLKEFGEVEFATSTTNDDLFLSLDHTLSASELGADDFIEGDVTIEVLVPVGTYKDQIDKSITTVDEFKDHYEGIEDYAEIYEYMIQDYEDFELTVEATWRNKTKDETYYFGVDAPDIGDKILDYVSELNLLVNKVHYKDINAPMTVDVLPTSAENPFEVGYLVDTLVLPKSVILSKFGNQTISFDYTFDNQVDEDLFYEAEFTPEEGIEGYDVSVFTFTPISDFEPTTEDNNIEDFVDEVGNVDPEILFTYVNSEEHEFSISVTITLYDKNGTPTHTKEDIRFFFKLVPGNIDSEIMEEVMDMDKLISIVNYNDAIAGIDGDSFEGIAKEEDTVYMSHLVDSIVIPQKITLNKFGDKELRFTTEVSGFDATTNAKTTEEVTIDGYNVIADVYTPLGGYNHHSTTIQDLANEIKNLETKDLYNYSQADETNLEINVTVKLYDKNEQPSQEESKEIKLKVRIIKADVDNEIMDEVIKSDDLLNIVNYKDIKDEFNGANVIGIASEAMDENKPIEIEHLVDTLVIPEKITLSEYGGKEIRVTHTITEGNKEFDKFFSDTKQTTIEGNEVKATTLTSLGDYENNSISTIEDLAREIDGQNAKEKYGYTQADNTGTIKIELNLALYENGVITKHERTVVFYVKVVKANLDKDVGKYILDNYNVINYIDHFNKYVSIKDDENYIQPKNNSTRQVVKNFNETIIIPKEFNDFDGFEGKSVAFEYDLGGDENRFIISHKTHEYEGNEISVVTLTPIGNNLDLPEEIDTMDKFISYMADNLGDVTAANALDNNYNVTLVISVNINGELVATQNYYFTLVPF